MKKHAADNPNREKTTPKKRATGGQTTQDLRKKHLRDQDHSISDEEMRNLNVEKQSEEEVPTRLPEGDERPHDVDKDRRFKTPWDVLGEG
jgi:hypothetical protein